MTAKTILMAGTILAAAMATPIWIKAAQSADESSKSRQNSTDIAAPIEGISTRNLVGTTIRDDAGESAGEIYDVIVDMNGRVSHAVVAVGGVLGVGGSYVVVPYRALQPAGDDVVKASMSKEELKNQPSFAYPADAGYLIANAYSVDQRSYIEKTEKQMQQWGEKVDHYAQKAQEKGAQASAEASQTVTDAWQNVEGEWRNLKNASADVWQDSKTSFQEAWSAFEETWTKAKEDS